MSDTTHTCRCTRPTRDHATQNLRKQAIEVLADRLLRPVSENA